MRRVARVFNWQDRLRRFMEEHSPHVCVLGASSQECHHIREHVLQVLLLLTLRHLVHCFRLVNPRKLRTFLLTSVNVCLTIEKRIRPSRTVFKIMDDNQRAIPDGLDTIHTLYADPSVPTLWESACGTAVAELRDYSQLVRQAVGLA
eukprot:8634277-Pyramimonas_sp.AAC.1